MLRNLTLFQNLQTIFLYKVFGNHLDNLKKNMNGSDKHGAANVLLLKYRASKKLFLLFFCSKYILNAFN